MPAESQTFGRKTVYYRDLRQASPISISLLSHPQPSKYPDRLPYCRFTVEGEAGTFELQVENAGVQAALAALPLGQYVTVVAAGSRDSAQLVVLGQDVTLPFPAAHPVPAEAQRPEPQTAEPSLARSYAEALIAAEKLVAAFKARYGREPSEAERAVACTLFISLDRSGGRRPLTRSRSGE